MELELPRVSLMPGPTPLHRLEQLSKVLDRPVWIKRDDLTGLAAGGNKTRKLEYHLAAAEAAGADTLVTLGAEQSNHACQTAAAAARRGLDSVLLLRGSASTPRIGNLYLDARLGAEVRLRESPDSDWGAQVVQELSEAGRRPFLIPYGGSNRLGVAAYARAGLELQKQIDAFGLEVDVVVHASSSGGTQAGLHLAVELGWLETSVLGISADLPGAELADLVRRLTNELEADQSWNPPPIDVWVSDAYIGPGYAKTDDRTEAAIDTLARTEGILTDPVYTAKAMAGLLDLAQTGALPGSHAIVFWHTGGLPGLLARA